MAEPFWFLVQTHSNAERQARDALTAPYRGCTVYLPLELVTVTHARRRVEKERAFFARYLFVLNQEQGVVVIRTAPGVTHLARRGVEPIMVPQQIVDQVRAREVMGVGPDGKPQAYMDAVQWDRDVQTLAQRLPVNSTVRVTDGPFASFSGTINQWRANERRADVLVDIFGRKTPVELEPCQFEAA